MTDWILQIQTHPIFGITATVAAYVGAAALWTRFGRLALLHPVLVATAVMGIMLVATNMAYEDYFAQTLLLHEMLGVIIVLLAVPLYRQFGLIRMAGIPLLLALISGAVVALVSALSLPVIANVPEELLATIAPKSATAAVAVEIADRLGGATGLTAVIVISTGIFGAVFGPTILRVVGVEDERAAGFALGVASHAIGTARAFQISDVAGAFASLGMILHALLAILFVPLALALIGP